MFPNNLNLQHGAFSQTCSSGVGRWYYAGAKPNVFPTVGSPDLNQTPLHPGTSIVSYGQKFPLARLKMLTNEVKVCAKCGKNCAKSMRNCNSCGASLQQVPITETENLLAGFALGLERCERFPLKIGIRRQTDRVVVFDDLLSLTCCHLLCVPTFAHLPDFRYLFERPLEGLRLLNELRHNAKLAVKDTFWNDEAFRDFYWRNVAAPNPPKGGADPTPASNTSTSGQLFEEYWRRDVIMGLNYPPSQYWLHLQVACLPFFPFHQNLLHTADHMHWHRFFGLDYVAVVLQNLIRVNMSIKLVQKDDTIPSSKDSKKAGEANGNNAGMNKPLQVVQFDAEGDVSELLLFFKNTFNIDYDKYHTDFIDRVQKSGQRLACYREHHFEKMVVVRPTAPTGAPEQTALAAGGTRPPNEYAETGTKVVLNLSDLSLAESQDANALQAADKKMMQSYGRPYSESTGKEEGLGYYSGCGAAPVDGDQMAKRKWWEWMRLQSQSSPQGSPRT
ncbi:unnamed protein product [Amoebophrya sp. A120]|nr:unnamed protein product [Amoebophrya sp. A120]|eukprot:GSA120T00002165001.1